MYKTRATQSAVVDANGGSRRTSCTNMWKIKFRVFVSVDPIPERPRYCYFVCIQYYFDKRLCRHLQLCGQCTGASYKPDSPYDLIIGTAAFDGRFDGRFYTGCMCLSAKLVSIPQVLEVCRQQIPTFNGRKNKTFQKDFLYFGSRYLPRED